VSLMPHGTVKIVNSLPAEYAPVEEKKTKKKAAKKQHCWASQQWYLVLSQSRYQFIPNG
jgi:hypothetical protein